MLTVSQPDDWLKGVEPSCLSAYQITDRSGSRRLITLRDTHRAVNEGGKELKRERVMLSV